MSKSLSHEQQTILDAAKKAYNTATGDLIQISARGVEMFCKKILDERQ